MAPAGDDVSDQCCPMDTWATGIDGEPVYECTCPDDCPCMCVDCICENWGEEP